MAVISAKVYLARSRKKKAKVSIREQLCLAKDSLNDKKVILQLQEALMKTEYQYIGLQQKLTRLLTPEQIEAAKICGCTPAEYALEWIELYKDSLRQIAPGFAHNVKNLVELKNEQNSY